MKNGMSPNRRQLIQALGLAGIAGCFCGCRAAPISGRKQLIIMPQKKEFLLAGRAYDQILDNEPASQNLPLVQLVHRVGQRIASVADRPEFKWEFQLLSGSRQCAFCLPGGKIAVYEGILPVCENEAGLAVVISHEVAHALARHAGERMSKNIWESGAKDVLNKFAMAGAPAKTERMMQACGIETEGGTPMPFSSKQESEADEIGVMLMAKAGYEPNEAPRFWQRFNQMDDDPPSEFQLTHPSTERRAIKLIALMGQAEQHYAVAQEKVGIGQVIVSRSSG